MNKYDARGYKKLRYRYIIGYMFVVWIVITVAVIMAPVTAIFFVLVAVGSGWQMGVLTERNDWDNWYHRGTDLPSERPEANSRTSDAQSGAGEKGRL